MNLNRIKKWTGLLCVGVSLGATGGASAVIVDLTANDNSGSANGGFFQQVPDQSTGTGVIEPFLRIQKNGTEEGFNTSISPPVGQPMPDVKVGTWTHDILLSAIPIVVNPAGAPAGSYYQFLLDLHENHGHDNEFISLSDLEIWTKSGGPLTEANSYNDLADGGATKVWDLDVGADGDSRVELNALLNPGSGAGDMFAYIPVSAVGTDGTKNLYLYSKFGIPNESDATFEEWAVLRSPIAQVPDGGGAVTLLGLSLAGMGLFRRLSRKA